MNVSADHRRWRSGLGIFLATFILGLGVVLIIPLQRNGQLVHQPPARDDVFIVNAFSGDLSYPALWHELGPSIANARAAELLVIGNSRTQFAIREDVVIEPLRKQGIEAFTLAVGYNEPGRFFYELIRRHDLRPPVLLLNVDDRFFSGNASPRAARMMKSSRWDAAKEFYGTRLAWWLEGKVHRFFPRWLPYEGDSFVLYRSATSGCWLPVLEPDRSEPFTVPPPGAFDDSISKRTDSFLAEFKREMDERKIQIILLATPHPELRLSRVQNLSRHWQAPLVAPPVDGLATTDGSHLTRAAAERYGEALVANLLELPAIRRLAEQ